MTDDPTLEFLRVSTALRVAYRERSEIKRKIRPELMKQNDKIFELRGLRAKALGKIYESYDTSELDHRKLEEE